MEYLEEDFDLGIDNFVDTTTKVPVIFVLDKSESMSWHDGIYSMWIGVNEFIKALKSDDYAKASVEVSILTFNHEVQEVLPFTPVNEVEEIEKFTASSTTDLSKAVHTAIDKINKQKKYYKENAIKHKAPWLVLLTDGDIVANEINDAVTLTTSLINSKKLTMFSIGTGNEVNTEQLKRFDPSKPVIFSPEQDDLVPLFEWLSATATGYSTVASGEKFQSEPLDRRYELVG